MIEIGVVTLILFALMPRFDLDVVVAFVCCKTRKSSQMSELMSVVGKCAKSQCALALML